MKILQIEGVIRNLLDRGGIESRCVNFEFDNKDDAVQHDDSVSAFSHARNGELKCYPSIGNSGQTFLQKLNLL